MEYLCIVFVLNGHCKGIIIIIVIIINIIIIIIIIQLS